MPNLFHFCKGNGELLGVFDCRLAAALEVSGMDDKSMDTALSFVSDLSKLPSVKRIVNKHHMEQDDDRGRGVDGNAAAVLPPYSGNDVAQYTCTTHLGPTGVDIRNCLVKLFR